MDHTSKVNPLVSLTSTHACIHTHMHTHVHTHIVVDLLVVDLRSSLAYFMMTHPLPIAGKSPIESLLARQLPTHTSAHTNTHARTHKRTHTHTYTRTRTHTLILLVFVHKV